jgi:hypothetical protein
LVSPPAYGYSVKREAPAALTVRASRSVGVDAKPFTSEEMKKDSAKKLLTKWVVLLVFELLKGVAKGAGLLLLSHLLR